MPRRLQPGRSRAQPDTDYRWQGRGGQRRLARQACTAHLAHGLLGPTEDRRDPTQACPRGLVCRPADRADEARAAGRVAEQAWPNRVAAGAAAAQHALRPHLLPSRRRHQRKVHDHVPFWRHCAGGHRRYVCRGPAASPPLPPGPRHLLARVRHLLLRRRPVLLVQEPRGAAPIAGTVRHHLAGCVLAHGLPRLHPRVHPRLLGHRDGRRLHRPAGGLPRLQPRSGATGCPGHLRPAAAFRRLLY
mmetsp:Transcript_27524/g.88910  ORF Transcript_27524/g.88910 Transcript_27524/m.88910 type:complete len:245 (-) Transcript_27524:722-1456(-)